MTVYVILRIIAGPFKNHPSLMEKPKACLVCRQRKVRCDAHMQGGGRCTNCVAAGVVRCIVPRPKRRESRKLKQILVQHPELTGEEIKEEPMVMEGNSTSNGYDVLGTNAADGGAFCFQKGSPGAYGVSAGATGRKEPYSCTGPLGVREENPIHLHPPPLPGKVESLARVEYYAGFASVSFTAQLLRDFMRAHPEKFPSTLSLPPEDMSYLRSLGCFTLPEPVTCQRYIDSYFALMNAQFPVVNEHQFRTDYYNLEGGDFPSLTLLQAVLYVGSFFYTEKGWTERECHQQRLNSRQFYRRARALLDLGVEVDTLCQIQAELIMTKYWYILTTVKTSGFAYIAANVAKAHSLGMQKDQSESTTLAVVDQRLYKRIWWSLYIRDTYMAALLGRPYAITEDVYTVKQPVPEDMIDTAASDVPCSQEGLLFVHRVRLAHGFRLVAKKIAKIEAKDFEPGETVEGLLRECDDVVLSWIEKLPKDLLFHIDDPSRNSPLSATIAMEYYSLLLIVHKVHIFQLQPNNDLKVSYPYSSWAITFKSCHMLATIGKYLQKTGATLLYPGTFTAFLAFAGTMLIYQLYNQDLKIVELARKGIETCIEVLESIKEAWPFASVHHFYLKSFYEDDEKRITIIKRMLAYGSKSQLQPRTSLNSTRTMDRLNDIRILPRILPCDGTKKQPKFVQNIFKNNQAWNPTPVASATGLLPNLGVGTGISVSEFSSRPNSPAINNNNDTNHNNAVSSPSYISPSPPLWQTQLPSIPRPALGIPPVSDYRQTPEIVSHSGSSPTILSQPLSHMGSGTNAILRTFDEAIPSNTMPNLSSSEWHPHIENLPPQNPEENYVDEFLLFSKLGGPSYGEFVSEDFLP